MLHLTLLEKKNKSMSKPKEGKKIKNIRVEINAV